MNSAALTRLWPRWNWTARDWALDFARRLGSDALFTATLAYLFFPALLFCLGWVRIWIGLPLALGILDGIRRSLPETAPRRTEAPGTLGGVWIIVTLAVCGGAVFFSGVAGYTPVIGVADPVKQHMSLFETMARPWPMAWEGEAVFGKPGPRVPAYHFFYYLVPGLVGKCFGWNAANHFLAFWVASGLVLIITWVARLAKVRSPWLALAFLAFGGLDVVAQTVLDVPSRLLPGVFPDLWWSQAGSSHPSMAEQQLHYPAHFVLFSWFPNHAVPCWLGIAVLMQEAVTRREGGNLVFLGSVLPMWSVFAALGVFPFLAGTCAALCLENRWRGLVTVRNLLTGPLLFALSALLLLSNDGGSQGRWLVPELLAAWPMLLLFYLVEFGALALLLPREVRSGREENLWWTLAMASLLLIPFYSQGVVNDFCGRVFMPALFVLLVLVARFLFSAGEGRRPANREGHRLAVWTLVTVGAAPSVHALWTNQRQAPSTLRPPALESVLPYHEYAAKYPEHAVQGLGPASSFFWKYLAKPLHIVREIPGDAVSRPIFISAEPESQWFYQGEPFRGSLRIDNQSASQVISLRHSGAGLRPDLIRGIRIRGELDIEDEHGRRLLTDVGTVKVAFRSGETAAFGPAPLQGQGTADAPWHLDIPAGALRRDRSLDLWIEVELLRPGLHTLRIDSIEIEASQVHYQVTAARQRGTGT